VFLLDGLCLAELALPFLTESGRTELFLFFTERALTVMQFLTEVVLTGLICFTENVLPGLKKFQ
jgi:hypothetical protein